MWGSKQERSEPHDENAGADPYRFSSCASSAKVADWKEAQERGDVIAVCDEARLSRKDPKPKIKILKATNTQDLLMTS